MPVCLSILPRYWMSKRTARERLETLDDLQDMARVSVQS